MNRILRTAGALQIAAYAVWIILLAVMLDKSKYVVLDIETNGLNSEKDDILSISFYLPDEQKEYTRFLPLELNPSINPSAFSINRITWIC